MYTSGNHTQTAPGGIVGIGRLASRIAEELVGQVPAGELILVDPDQTTNASAVEANITFILGNGRDRTAALRAEQVRRRVHRSCILHARVRLLAGGEAREEQTEENEAQDGLQIDLPRDGFEHLVASLVGGFAGAMGERGIVGVDMADVRSALVHPGNVVRMGVGYGAGERRALDAACKSITGLAVDGYPLRRATGIFVLVSGGSLKLTEVAEASRLVRSAAGKHTHVCPGAYPDERLGRLLRVTLVVSSPSDAQ